MPFNDASNPNQEADNLIFQNAAKATAQRRKREADAERAARTDAPTGTVGSYDTTTGDWVVTLPSGGTVRAQLNSNAQPTGRVPVQRNADSQVSAIASPPTEANFATLIEQIDTLSRQLVSLMGPNVASGDPNNQTIPGILDIPSRYPNDLYFDADSGTLWRYDTDSAAATPNPQWVPLFQLLQNSDKPPTATIYIDGAIAVATDGTVYTGTVSGGWSELSGGTAAPVSRLLLLTTFGAYITNVASFTTTTVDLNSWGLFEIQDTDNFWSVAQPQRIYFPATGIYQIKLISGGEMPIFGSNLDSEWLLTWRIYRDDDSLWGKIDWTHYYSRNDNNAVYVGQDTARFLFEANLYVDDTTQTHYMVLEFEHATYRQDTASYLPSTFGADYVSVMVEKIADI